MRTTVKPSVPYNKEFFDDLTRRFLERMEGAREAEALHLFRGIMATNLLEAYGEIGLRRGDPYNFVHVVGERDASVGLEVGFEASPKTIIYRFFTDPFPDLRDVVDHQKLDATYMDFKVLYLLGDKWRYETTKHLWEGDPFTEHVITNVSDLL